MSSCRENIKVFENTLCLCNTVYKNDTAEAMRNTEVIFNGASLIKEKGNKEQNIRVVTAGSVSAIEGVVAGRRVAALNFADALTPGGLIWEGETTQEEDLCRCSNLYPCISQDKVFDNYYGYNRSLENDIYSDRLIYSSDVLFFKDETYWCLSIPVKCDVITCPAPVECNDINIFKQRIKSIIGAAYKAGVDRLILGKWGTGSFGNDPVLVATAFKEVLDEYKLFDVVYFPLFDDSESSDIFQEILEG